MGGGVRGAGRWKSHRLLGVEVALALLTLGPRRAGVAIPARRIHTGVRLASLCMLVGLWTAPCAVRARCALPRVLRHGEAWGGMVMEEGALGVLGFEGLLDLLRSLDVHRALRRRQRLPVLAQQHGHRSVGPGCRREETG